MKPGNKAFAFPVPTLTGPVMDASARHVRKTPVVARHCKPVLLAGRNNAAPEAELLDGWEAGNILDKSHVGGGALQANPANRLQEAVWVELLVKGQNILLRKTGLLLSIAGT